MQLGALTEWAHGLAEVERLQLYVEPWNVGFWRAGESCGYEREGLLRSWQRVGSLRKDMYVYSILAETPPTIHSHGGRPRGAPKHAAGAGSAGHEDR